MLAAQNYPRSTISSQAIRDTPDDSLSNFALPGSFRRDLSQTNEASLWRMTSNAPEDLQPASWRTRLREILSTLGIPINSDLLKRVRVEHTGRNLESLKNLRILHTNNLTEYTYSLDSLPTVEALLALHEDLLPSDQHTNQIVVGIKKELARNTREFSILATLSLNLCAHPILSRDLTNNRVRYERAAHEIYRSTVDIVGLQEIWSSEALKALRATGFRYISCSDSTPGLLGRSGLVTLSRYPIIASQSYYFRHFSGIERFVRKGALFTEIDHPTIGQVQIWNIHLASPPESINKHLTTDKRAGSIRSTQYEDLRNWIASKKRAEVPIIVVGDFNAHLDSDESEIHLLGEDLFTLRHNISGHPVADTLNWATFDPTTNPYARSKADGPMRLDRTVIPRVAGNERIKAITSSVVMNAHPVSDHFGLQSRFALI